MRGLAVLTSDCPDNKIEEGVDAREQCAQCCPMYASSRQQDGEAPPALTVCTTHICSRKKCNIHRCPCAPLCLTMKSYSQHRTVAPSAVCVPPLSRFDSTFTDSCSQSAASDSIVCLSSHCAASGSSTPPYAIKTGAMNPRQRNSRSTTPILSISLDQ